MGFTPLQFSKSWMERRDFPTYEPDEEHVRADLQLLHDETRDCFNALVSLLNSARAAENLPIRTGRLHSSNVQLALEEVLTATEQAAAGTIPNSTIGMEKLTPALLDRIYGGRLWVGLDSPGPEHNPGSDFPVGQLWLRPGHHIPNLAGQTWQASGCTVSARASGWVMTSDGSMTAMSAAQTLENLGSPGDHMAVFLRVRSHSAHLSAMSLYLNGLEQELRDGPVSFETTLDAAGGLEILLAAQMPYAESGLEVEPADLVVVNTSFVERQAPWAHGKDHWAAYLAERAPFDSLDPDWSLFGQDAPGHWQLLSCRIWPTDRGGTGLTAYKPGQLLYADEHSRLRPLEPPAEESYLAFDRTPRWISHEALRQKLHPCHVLTGSYVGDGQARTLALPVEPAALWLAADSGPCHGSIVYDWPTFLVQGLQRQESIYGKAENTHNSPGTGSVVLRGKDLTFSATSQYGQPMETSFGNRTGIAYTWVAVYEEVPHAA